MTPRVYLEAYRRKNNLSLKQLAAKIDYDSGNLCKILNRPYVGIRADTAVKFAKRLGITVEELMGLGSGSKEEGRER